MDPFTEFKGTRFGYLTRRDRAQLARTLTDARRQQLEANLKASNAPGDTTFDRLDQFDENRFVLGEQLLNQYVVTDEGIDDVLLRGLRKSNPGASAEDVDKLDLSDEEALQLSLKLSGRHLRKQEGEAAPAASDQPADPTPPGSSPASPTT